MEIITQNDKYHHWIVFKLLDYNIFVDWIDYKLPIPNLHYMDSDLYLYIGWKINGYFGTTKSIDFLNDIIARFIITFKNNIERIDIKEPPKEMINDCVGRTSKNTYELKEFSQKLESLKTKKLPPSRSDMFDDYTFWAIKLFVEDTIQENGSIEYDYLEHWALTNFIEHKERSTIKAKCRSVYEYYRKNHFKIPRRQKKYKTHQNYL